MNAIIKDTSSDLRPTMVKTRRWNSRSGTSYETMKHNRESNTKSRLYFDVEGETLLEDFGNRASRPHKIYRTFLAEAAKKLGLPEGTKFNWSQKAGCSCGCSPGFIVADHFGSDFWVTLSEEAPVAENHELALARRVQLGDKVAYDELATGQLSLKL